MAQERQVRGQREAQPGEEGGRRQRGGGGWGMGLFGGGGFRGMFDSGVTSRQFESMKATLRLSAEQQEAVDALFEAYQDSSTRLNNEMREEMDQMREDMRAAMMDGGPDRELIRRMGERTEKARKARKDLEAGLFSDIKSVLSAEQAQRWPRVEAGYRRESSIGRGLMSGERVDVVRLVEDLKLPQAERESLDAVLDQYAADLDRELTARNEFLEKAMAEARELFQSGDEERIEKLFNDGRALSMRVRDVNRRYARQIEGMLADESRSKFIEAFQRESFPQVYRPTTAGRSLEAASKLADLDAEQKASLDSISESYKRELSAINKQLEAAAEKREANFSPADMMGRFGRGGGGGGGDEQTRELRDRRRALDESTIEKIRGILKPEQFEKLPGREDRGGGFGRDDGGGQGDGGGQRRNRRNNNDDRPNRDIPRPSPGPTAR
ncbi:MAG: Spy/CpxP family protein refolding chaperone [Phycisphaerales bacterium]